MHVLGVIVANKFGARVRRAAIIVHVSGKNFMAFTSFITNEYTFNRSECNEKNELNKAQKDQIILLWKSRDTYGEYKENEYAT